MIRSVVLSALFFSGIASGTGFQVTFLDGRSETIVHSSLKLAPAEVGSVVPLKFRVRAGTVAFKLKLFELEGTDFKLVWRPAPPFTLMAGAYVDLDAEFRPQIPGVASAVLKVNDTQYPIAGVATPGAVVRLDGTPVRPRERTPFGSAELGQAVARKIVVENSAAAAIAITKFDFSGSAFRAPQQRVPFELAPGASVTLDAVFEPRTPGTHGAVLAVNSQEFVFEALATAPPIPEPRLVFDTAALASGQAAKVAVKLDSPAKWEAEGVLRMEFSGAWSDPAARLLSGDGRALAFRIAAGEDTARFGSALAADFQTGTTAGRIVFKLELGPHRLESAADLGQLPVGFDEATAARKDMTVELKLTAFDNTRTASALSFTFFDRAGRQVGRAPVRVDAAQDFRRYFDSTTSGGVFSLRAVFPVRGAIAEIGSVEVEVVNIQGIARRNVKMQE